MLKNHDQNDPKNDFYSYSSNFNWLVRLTPLFILKYLHLSLYKYDPYISKIENKLEFLSTFYYKVTFPYRDFYRVHLQGIIRRIKRSFQYMKLGWYSNDWDYTSIFELLSFKLSRMEPVIRNGHHLNSEGTADQIKIVKDLLNQINNTSDHEYITELEEKFPKFKLCSIFDKDEIRHVHLTENGAKRVYYELSNFYNELSEEDQELRQKELNRLSSYYYNLKIANLRVIFHILTPSFGSYKKSIELKNEEIMEKLFITHENYYDNLDKLRYNHNGIFSWWD